MKIRIEKWTEHGKFAVGIGNNQYYADIEQHPEPPQQLIDAAGDDLAFALMDMAKHHNLTVEIDNGHPVPVA